MSDFASFARSHGVMIDRDPPIGVWRRYKTVDHPRKKNGSVKFMGDIGFVRNFATMDETAIWRPDGAQPIAFDDARIKALRKYEDQQRWKAIVRMREYFADLPRLQGGHPYLERKGLSMRGCSVLRRDGDDLAIPMYRNGFLFSVQTISPDGEKRYRAGCPMRGCSLTLRGTQSCTVVCLTEGFATGLAVYQSIPNAAVVVCFDAGNMVEVARHLNVSGLTVVCADNDHGTALRSGVNPGLEKGRQAAESLGCGVAYPEGIKGSDWADLLLELGLEKGPPRLRMDIMRGARHVRPSG